MVYTPDEWLWSSLLCMVGKKEFQNWLATYALLSLFAKKLSASNVLYIQFVNKV
jgi:hypothetical protein